MADARVQWFPDFCRLPRIAAVLAIAQLVVVVVRLAPHPGSSWSPAEFIAASAFALWLGLVIAVVYCKARPVAGAAAAAARHRLRAAAAAADRLPPRPGMVQASTSAGHALHAAAVAALAVPGQRGGFVDADRGADAALFLCQRAVALARARGLEGEVDALQARIRPHFLFNSMNTIASLVRTDPATAERAVETLSELFRAALGAGQGESTLGEESPSRSVTWRSRACAWGRACACTGRWPRTRRASCACRGWCCSRCWRTRCCMASRAARRRRDPHRGRARGAPPAHRGQQSRVTDA
jgi:two-component system sensor histidine kinase AlgZ